MNFSDIPAWVQAISVVVPPVIAGVAWFIRTDMKMARMAERLDSTERKLDKLGDLKERLALLEQKIDLSFDRISEEIRTLRDK